MGGCLGIQIVDLLRTNVTTSAQHTGNTTLPVELLLQHMEHERSLFQVWTRSRLEQKRCSNFGRFQRTIEEYLFG